MQTGTYRRYVVANTSVREASAFLDEDSDFLSLSTLCWPVNRGEVFRDCVLDVFNGFVSGRACDQQPGSPGQETL